MKLSQWAKSQGITYRTAWNWFKTGKMPIKTIQTKTGTILVDVPIPPVEDTKQNENRGV